MTSDHQIVADGKIVGIYYTLKDQQGRVLDSNRRGGKPLAFLQGSGNILPALEALLLGKKKNDFVDVTLAAVDGYGEPKPELIHKLPRTAFPPERKLEVGMRFTGKDAEGRPRSLLVLEVGETELTVDENHPLAGQPLHFEVTVCGVREATAEETQHGHAHGAGGAHGH